MGPVFLKILPLKAALENMKVSISIILSEAYGNNLS